MTNEKFEIALPEVINGAKKRDDTRTYQFASSILTQYRETFGNGRRRYRRKCERLFARYLRPIDKNPAEQSPEGQ